MRAKTHRTLVLGRVTNLTKSPSFTPTGNCWPPMYVTLGKDEYRETRINLSCRRNSRKIAQDDSQDGVASQLCSQPYLFPFSNVYIYSHALLISLVNFSVVFTLRIRTPGSQYLPACSPLLIPHVDENTSPYSSFE